MDFSPVQAGPVACLLKTVPKWLDDGAEKILRSDETPNLQQSAAKRNFQSTTLIEKILNEFLESVVVVSEWLSKCSAQHGVVLILHLDVINQLLWVSEKWDLNDKSQDVGESHN